MSLFGRSTRDEDRPSEGGAAPPAAGPEDRGFVTQHTDRTRTAGVQGGKDMAHIGKSISIKGDLSGDEDLVIEGDVEGRVELPNNQVTIGADGRVRADVHAQAVVVVGRVTGNVTGLERVEVQDSGVVDGDLKAPRLAVQEGAQLNGTVQMATGKPAGKSAERPGERAAGERAEKGPEGAPASPAGKADPLAARGA